MTKHDPFRTTAALDEVLLDVATIIELSPRDRSIAENRYRQLKTHLERPKSPLAPYLRDGVSMIYAQGSIATSTTIVSGTDDDRFDVDAIVEIDVPAAWSDAHALDLLEIALQGFPRATAIVRMTRCVQVQFPFMHMDVTILDRSKRLVIARAGEIFHAPDKGRAMRVSSNPWGFTDWFRSRVGERHDTFADARRRHRATLSKNHLLADDDELLVKAEQHPLPPAIPAAIDAQEAVALMLLKRFVNLRYETCSLRQPPSIYLTKRAGDVGYIAEGLSAQLYYLANSTARILRRHLADGTRPNEKNPSYYEDRINDRWPEAGAQGARDMEVFATALEHLAARLNDMATASLPEIAKGIDELFGERIGKQEREALAKRYDRRADAAPILAQHRTGAVFAPGIVTSRETLREVPRHNFHPFRLGSDDDE